MLGRPPSVRVAGRRSVGPPAGPRADGGENGPRPSRGAHTECRIPQSARGTAMSPFDDRPAPVDAAADPHLSGLFAPQRSETASGPLEVTGRLPAGLRGSYVRNGPHPRFDPIGSYLYPIGRGGMVRR